MLADPMLSCRREEREQARAAQAFEAASQAKALIQTWKQPRLGPGHTSLPAELWGWVLERMLTQASLWDLRATVQQLCHVSLACKGLYSAVQQQGWPKLGRLLQPLWTPLHLPSQGSEVDQPAARRPKRASDQPRQPASAAAQGHLCILWHALVR